MHKPRLEFRHFAARVLPDVVALGNFGYLADDHLESSESNAGKNGGLAIALPKTRFMAKTEGEVYAEKRGRVVIRHRSGDEVVAIIEIVSPGNKSSRYALESFLPNRVAFPS